MPQILFYRQARFDGGVRTGIDVDGTECWHRFEPGAEENYDPGLLWYVDLRFEGNALPTDPDEAREWLLAHADELNETLHLFEAEYFAGLDVTPYPIRFQVRDFGPGVSVEVAASASRRLEGRGLMVNLLEIVDGWRDTLSGLDRMSVV